MGNSVTDMKTSNNVEEGGHSIEINSLPEKLRKTLSQFDTDGDGTIDVRELELIQKEMENEHSQNKFYRRLLIIGFVIWLLTIGAIAAVVTGVVEGTKEMHATGDKLTSTNGNVLQCANNDFYVNANGQIVQRVDSGSGRRLQASSVPVVVASPSYIQAFDYKTPDDALDGAKTLTFYTPTKAASVTLQVSSYSRGGGDNANELHVATLQGHILANKTGNFLYTQDMLLAESMISQGFMFLSVNETYSTYLFALGYNQLVITSIKIVANSTDGNETSAPDFVAKSELGCSNGKGMYFVNSPSCMPTTAPTPKPAPPSPVPTLAPTEPPAIVQIPGKTSCVPFGRGWAQVTGFASYDYSGKYNGDLFTCMWIGDATKDPGACTITVNGKTYDWLDTGFQQISPITFTQNNQAYFEGGVSYCDPSGCSDPTPVIDGCCDFYGCHTGDCLTPPTVCYYAPYVPPPPQPKVPCYGACPAPQKQQGIGSISTSSPPKVVSTVQAG